ncbi:MAG: hypothetical protein ACRYG7_09505 [Janthinobacterium lividum]
MIHLSGTLVADGSSDRLLKPILEWVLSQHLPPGSAINIQVPDWGRFPRPVPTLPAKLLAAKEFFTADVYFIHRDTEKTTTWQERSTEIDHDVQQVSTAISYVRIVPVQMTETWLLHNEQAIREAAENPSGRSYIVLPPLKKLEALPDAKMHLLGILREASGLTGRRLKKFEAHERRRLHRLADLQQEQGFAVLRALPAFQALEKEIIALVAAWPTSGSS